jgi:glycosyltransferase involved in cell wall biosynthesis
MAKIVIDARIIGTGTGVYAEGILGELQKMDSKNEYVVILDPDAKWKVSSTNPNFKEYRSKNTYRKDTFFLRGNLSLAWEMYKLKADTFWGTFQHIPFFYFKKNTLLTVHDLTQVRIKNPKNKAERREAWKRDKKAVVKEKIRKLPFSIIPNSVLMRLLNVVSFKFSVWRAKHIFVPSNYVKQDVIDYFRIPDSKVSVTVNGGVILKEDKRSPSQAEGRLFGKLRMTKGVAKLKDKEFLLYVGTDFAHKNLNILVEVLDLIGDRRPKLNLVFAGKGDRNYLTMQAKAKELGLEDRVHILGFVSDAEKVWLFKNAKLYVFPSLSEGFGIPALEAMAYELPVLASDRTAIPEVCGDGAVYFNPEDKQDIAEKILSTIDNTKLKAELVKKGKKRNELFRWSNAAGVVLNELHKYE